jgi:ribosomal protein L11 methyltransferase
VIRLAVRVARADAEAVLAELLQLVPAGLEEREDGDAVEFVLYGASGELPDVGSVCAEVATGYVHVTTSEIADDWNERWRSFHTALDVGSLRVRPPWEPARDGALDVVIDPGQAFGTGSHPTTRLVLELLSELEPAGALADWGCGSGILAISAAKLGWAPVLACDHDPASVEATLAGASANGVALEVSRCDLRVVEGPWAPTVLANLVRPLLLDVARVMTRPPERLIASGLLPGEVDEVVAAFAQMREVRRVEGDGWASVYLHSE